ncbi:DUF4202 domain-containing protein [Flagellimonas sp. HMM57]|uniref:DUF4202 domain-containing protein n=1 Tax=unclassified Flagellimonas TaxID=2644544 RepID=UPI0013D1FD2F|nr:MULTISPECIES: DUF4202 domain-containing protein [unclassified Flagellimonas]UII77769.1 DUF4202 domain-containing protein [Flagellimonas sp. HMM57]
MGISTKQAEAFRLFDEANRKDPNSEVFEGKSYPKELLYAQRMTETLNAFAPEASEALRLTARCQHICRWEIPRDAYEMNRTGYLKWRQELKKFHAQKSRELLEIAGYDNDLIEQVEFLLLKKQLKKNEETQTLEDVICLVFLNYYFEPFAAKHDNTKVIDILQKTWRKMSKKGQQAALKLHFSEKSANLIQQAITA